MSESRKIPPRTNPSDSIMMKIRRMNPSHLVPIRRSYEITIPRTNVYDPYPIMVPFSPKLFKRVNVLHPIPQNPRTVSLETEDQHASNYFCKIEKERQLRERFHNAYSRYYYGDTINKELYRKYIRESLKQQMLEKESIHTTMRKMRQHVKSYRASEGKESIEAFRRDVEDLETDVTKSRLKLEFLHQFRDENKQLMEESLKRKKLEEVQEKIKERQLLLLNPINWSSTLT